MGKLSLPFSPVARRRGAQVLLGLAALLLVDVVYQLGMHVTWRIWISRQNRALQAIAAPSTQPAKKEKGSRPQEIATDLRKRNIFTAPKPTGHGVALTGVIFDRAMFSTREGGNVTLKVGESGNGITVKAINNYEVVIEYQGKPETMKLFGEGGGGGGMGAAQMGGPGGEPRMMVAPGGAMPAGIRMEGGVPAGVDLSNLPPEIREQMQNKGRRRGR